MTYEQQTKESGRFAPEDYVPISVEPFPNPVPPEETFTVTVWVSPGKAEDAPAPQVSLTLTLTCGTMDGFPVQVEIPAGSTSGTSDPIAAPEPGTNHLITTQHGAGEASSTLVAAPL